MKKLLLWLVMVVVMLAVLLGVMDFIPIIGSGTVMVPWSIILMAIGNWERGIAMLAVWGVICVFRRVIEPKFVGDQTGLHPLVALLAIYVGLKIGSLLGMILAPVLVLIAACILGHLLHQFVAFRVYRCVVERIFSSRYAQKACTLFLSLGTQTRHFEQSLARCKGAIGQTEINDVLCQRRSQSGNIGEQMLRSGVEVYAYRVHTTLNCQVERLFQCALIYIVLILPYPDGLRVNLYQFGQRVGQPTANTHGTAHRYVVVGEFLAG